MIPADVLKFPERGVVEGRQRGRLWILKSGRFAPFRGGLMPAIRKDGIGCPASGRSQRRTHEDENQRRPFLGPATPFCRMIPLCEESVRVDGGAR